MVTMILGLVVTIVSWAVAWSSVPVLSEHSFFSLWVGYILVINGLSEFVFDDSLLRRMRSKFLLLFVVSIPFWWFFESINLIVQNWSYVFPHPISNARYAIEASISFSTVIPAVLSTSFLFNRYIIRLGHKMRYRPIRIRARVLGLLVLLGAAFACLLPVVPTIAFPLVWIAPTLLFEPILYALNRNSMLDRIERGEWRLPIATMSAALFCGFWWEFWNYYSMPKWIYNIPYVGFLEIFEMPVLGYLGYPFFGLIVYSYTVLALFVLHGQDFLLLETRQFQDRARGAYS